MKSHAGQHTLEVEVTENTRLDEGMKPSVLEEPIRVIADERLSALSEHSDPRRAVLVPEKGPSEEITFIR